MMSYIRILGGTAAVSGGLYAFYRFRDKKQQVCIEAVYSSLTSFSFHVFQCSFEMGLFTNLFIARASCNSDLLASSLE